MTSRFVGISLVVACTRAFATSRNHLATAALAACLSGVNPACRIEATNGTRRSCTSGTDEALHLSLRLRPVWLAQARHEPGVASVIEEPRVEAMDAALVRVPLDHYRAHVDLGTIRLRSNVSGQINFNARLEAGRRRLRSPTTSRLTCLPETIALAF